MLKYKYTKTLLFTKHIDSKCFGHLCQQVAELLHCGMITEYCRYEIDLDLHSFE